MKIREKRQSSGYILIRNLPKSLSEGDVIVFASQYGEILDCYLGKDQDTGKSRGHCFIKYEDPRSCMLAEDNLRGYVLGGNKLYVAEVPEFHDPKIEDGDLRRKSIFDVEKYQEIEDDPDFDPSLIESEEKKKKRLAKRVRDVRLMRAEQKAMERKIEEDWEADHPKPDYVPENLRWGSYEIKEPIRHEDLPEDAKVTIEQEEQGRREYLLAQLVEAELQKERKRKNEKQKRKAKKKRKKERKVKKEKKNHIKKEKVKKEKKKRSKRHRSSDLERRRS